MGTGKQYLVPGHLVFECFLFLLPIALVLQDLPADSTGELAHLRAFIEEHMDVCKWVGIAVIIIQVGSVPLFFYGLTFSSISGRLLIEIGQIIQESSTEVYWIAADSVEKLSYCSLNWCLFRTKVKLRVVYFVGYTQWRFIMVPQNSGILLSSKELSLLQV